MRVNLDNLRNDSLDRRPNFVERGGGQKVGRLDLHVNRVRDVAVAHPEGALGGLDKAVHVIEAFGLGDADTVLVTEITCRLPGCPPLETVIAFWTADTTRHHYRVFKKAIEVVANDLPPRWYRPALVVDDNASMDCGC